MEREKRRITIKFNKDSKVGELISPVNNNLRKLDPIWRLCSANELDPNWLAMGA